MKTLIIKLGATGDVVRTTTLLNELQGEVYWMTSDLNRGMLEGHPAITEIIPWSLRGKLYTRRFYDLIINLEDTPEAAQIVSANTCGDLYGAYLGTNGKVVYSHNAREWFDMSLISRFGRKKADDLKLLNRKSYQQIIFSGLGLSFSDQSYYLPQPGYSELRGDIAIAPKAGSVWPMKEWAYYDDLRQMLEEEGFKVNFLPMRETLKEHLGDVSNHGLLVSGDSLPMHIALGYRIPCVSLFICTSPWEIHDYGIQTKIVSPGLAQFFYRREYQEPAATSIPIEPVYNACTQILVQQLFLENFAN
jgi:ADP-heptose:LPS heptosyltransferase